MSLVDDTEIPFDGSAILTFNRSTSSFVVDDADDSDADEDNVNVGSTYILPEVIKNFLLYFYKHFKEQNVGEINAIYETHFNQLTERYFKASAWPPAESIAQLVDNGKKNNRR
jgi:hypothetical protein